jgi:hypothetical protein
MMDAERIAEGVAPLLIIIEQLDQRVKDLEEQLRLATLRGDSLDRQVEEGMDREEKLGNQCDGLKIQNVFLANEILTVRQELAEARAEIDRLNTGYKGGRHG